MEKDILLPITRRRPLEEEKKSRAISRHDFFGWIERNFSLSFFLHFGTKIDRSRTLDHVVWNIWDIYQKKKKIDRRNFYFVRSIYCPTQTERNLTLIVLDFSNKLKSSKSSLCHANRWLEKRKKKKKSRLDERGNCNTWRAILESWIESDKRRAVGYRDEIT